MSAVTVEQVKQALLIISIVGEAIRDLKIVPSGELYAHLMGKLSLQEYELVLERLKDAKLIKVENHLITWVG